MFYNFTASNDRSIFRKNSHIINSFYQMIYCNFRLLVDFFIQHLFACHIIDPDKTRTFTINPKSILSRIRKHLYFCVFLNFFIRVYDSAFRPICDPQKHRGGCFYANPFFFNRFRQAIFIVGINPFISGFYVSFVYYCFSFFSSVGDKSRDNYQKKNDPNQEMPIYRHFWR